jgi:hypothetical protein
VCVGIYRYILIQILSYLVTAVDFFHEGDRHHIPHEQLGALNKVLHKHKVGGMFFAKLLDVAEQREKKLKSMLQGTRQGKGMSRIR